MGQFTYNEDKTEARVNFQAHKFPYTASVYYQCNVRLCIKHGGGCSNTVHNCYYDTNSLALSIIIILLFFNNFIFTLLENIAWKIFTSLHDY